MSESTVSVPLPHAEGVRGGLESGAALSMPSPDPSRMREGSIRSDFPGLRTADGKPWHYLDTAATAQKPQAVIDATIRAMGADYATVHRGVYSRSADMTLAFEAARLRVARFIGASNVIRGKGLEGSRVEFAGMPVRCSGAKINPGVSIPVSIRPHDVAISEARREGENTVPATVVRQVFLGGSRDYMVEAKDGTQLRVLTGAGDNIPQGSAVWLYLPPERCRALSG